MIYPDAWNSIPANALKIRADGEEHGDDRQEALFNPRNINVASQR
jgi:hypothetical protein